MWAESFRSLRLLGKYALEGVVRDKDRAANTDGRKTAILYRLINLIDAHPVFASEILWPFESQRRRRCRRSLAAFSVLIDEPHRKSEGTDDCA
jgi:hypothetical protein